MNNVDFQVNGNILTIKVDLSKDFGPSASGKTIQVASTLGNKNVKDDTFMGLNVYRKR
jgi:hypothetical protein